jgi:low temperature requirement protein LtrA
MIAGIIFFAVGVKKTLAHVGEPLHTVPAVALCGGVALYYLAHVAFRLRNMHTWAVRRVVCAGILVALIPLATTLPALASLAIVAAVSSGVIAYEAIRYAEARERLRKAALSPG